jgi:hypothetical protein
MLVLFAGKGGGNGSNQVAFYRKIPIFSLQSFAKLALIIVLCGIYTEMRKTYRQL